MNKKYLSIFLTLFFYQLYSTAEQSNIEQPDFKDPIHLFSKRDLVENLKLEEKLAEEFPDEATIFSILAFLKKQITSQTIADALKGPQIPEIAHHPKRQKVYSGEITEPTHIVLVFSGEPTLEETVKGLKKNRVAQNFLIDFDGSIYPVTAEGESIEDALKHRPFAVGISGKVVEGKNEERDMNAVSLAISVVGHDTQAATLEQEESLIKLIKWLKNKFNIKAYNIVDYGTIALPYGRRKTQENLPWEKLAQQKLTIWPNHQNFNTQDFDSARTSDYKFVSSGLRKIGYLTHTRTNPDNTFKAALLTFKKHYKCELSDDEKSIEKTLTDDVLTHLDVKITNEVIAKIIDLIEQMENISPELKDIYPKPIYPAKK